MSVGKPLSQELINRVQAMVDNPGIGVKVTRFRLCIGRTTLWRILTTHVASDIVTRRIQSYISEHPEQH